MKRTVGFGLVLVVMAAIVGWSTGCGGGDGDGAGVDLSGAWELVDLNTSSFGTSDVSVYAIDRTWTVSQDGTVLSGVERGTDTLAGTVTELAATIVVNAPDGTVTYSGQANTSGSRINGTWSRSGNARYGAFVAMKRLPGVPMEISGRWTVVDPVAGSTAVYDFAQTGAAVTGASTTPGTSSYSGTLAGYTLNLVVLRDGTPIGSAVCTLSDSGNICYGIFRNGLAHEVGGLLLYRAE